jgi:hypothetical protein
MTHRRFTALCALSFALAFTGPAMACATKDELIEQLAAEVPEARIIFAAGEAAIRIRDGIGTVLGQRIAADGEFFLIDLPRAEVTYVVRFALGCATHQGRFPTHLVQDWLAVSAGSGGP